MARNSQEREVVFLVVRSILVKVSDLPFPYIIQVARDAETNCATSAGLGEDDGLDCNGELYS
jgi:hypothetical protein